MAQPHIYIHTHRSPGPWETCGERGLDSKVTTNSLDCLDLFDIHKLVFREAFKSLNVEFHQLLKWVSNGSRLSESRLKQFALCSLSAWICCGIQTLVTLHATILS